MTKNNRNTWFVGILAIAAILIGMRLALPSYVTRYVQKTIDNMEGYSGTIREVDIHLWRGAYAIHGIKITKDTQGAPVPFLDIPTMDIAVEWRALLLGGVVAVVKLKNPVVNFAVSQGGQSQTGVEANWAQALDQLAPTEINLFTIENGTVTYQDFSAQPKVDLFIRNITLEAKNLRNVEDKADPLPSPFTLRGNSIGKGSLAADGRVNILRKIPDIDLDMRLEQVHLPALNDYTRHFAAVDFIRGIVDLYIELAIKDGKVTGYIKPIATDIEFIDLAEQDKNPFDVAWEAIVATFSTIFKNHPKDQLATKIPLEGDLSNPEANRWEAFIGIFRNAFVQAFSRNIDGTINFQNVNETED